MHKINFHTVCRVVVYCCLLFSIEILYANNTSNKNIISQGEWVDSDKLQPGMKILTSDNTVLIVTKKWQRKNSPTTTFNLTVKDSHTYFISSLNLWSHNVTTCYEQDPFSPKQKAVNDGTPPKETNSKDFYDNSLAKIGIYSDEGEEIIIMLYADSPLNVINHADDIVNLGIKKLKNKVSFRTHQNNFDTPRKINNIRNAFKNNPKVKEINISTTNTNSIAIDIVLKRGFE